MARFNKVLTVNDDLEEDPKHTGSSEKNPKSLAEMKEEYAALKAARKARPVDLEAKADSDGDGVEDGPNDILEGEVACTWCCAAMSLPC